jgi:hypothetical protein
MTQQGKVERFGLPKLPESQPEIDLQIILIISESPVFDTTFRTMSPLILTKA